MLKIAEMCVNLHPNLNLIQTHETNKDYMRVAHGSVCRDFVPQIER